MTHDTQMRDALRKQRLYNEAINTLKFLENERELCEHDAFIVAMLVAKSLLRETRHA